MAAHFNSEGHVLSNAKFVGLEKVWKGWVTYRRVQEQRWIGLFDTHRSAGGLNKKKGSWKFRKPGRWIIDV